jgi:hypothetical protein
MPGQRGLFKGLDYSNYNIMVIHILSPIDYRPDRPEISLFLGQRKSPP